MSEGTAVVFQVGDRVKYEYEGYVDYGVITEKDDSIYTDYGNIWAFWDNTKMMQNSSSKCLTLISRKEQPKPLPKYPPHEYADVIKHWADGGDIQYQCNKGWLDYNIRDIVPYIGSGDVICYWRIKPETEIISYRIGITKDNQVKVYHQAPTLDDAYGSDAFKEWLDPEWRTIEVEK